jgi:hypothetical protein
MTFHCCGALSETATRPTTRRADGLTVRERLWLWGHDAGAHNDGWGLPAPSRIMPAEAAFYLGIPNLIMVRYQGRPPLPLDQFAVALRPLRRVVWSAVGAHGQTNEEERSHVLDLAARHANITGIMLDDFFTSTPSSSTHQGREEMGEPAALPLDKLREVRDRLSAGDRRLDLWAVIYEHQVEPRLAPFLELLDVVSLWAWDSQKLRGMNESLGRLEVLAPRCGKVLGCYLWDYGNKRPMPQDLMQEQCEMGLRWLRQGRIEGMIFLASCICDLELTTVEWTRDWIAKVGDEAVYLVANSRA